MNKNKKPTELMIQAMRKAGDKNPTVARAGAEELVVALQVPLKEAIFPGDITDFYTSDPRPPGTHTEYPLDWVTPGLEGDYRAYFIPSIGALPQRVVEGGFITIPTYEVGATLTVPLKYIRDANWIVLKNAMRVLESSFVMKNNTDAWRLVVAAAVARNLVVYDDAALPGYASKALWALAQVAMARNAGGNTSSVNRGKLSRLYVSPESIGDVRNWDLTQLDDVTRKEFFDGGDVEVIRVMGTDTRSLVELGASATSAEFYNFFTINLAASFQTYTYTGSGGGSKTKVEFGIGLDLTRDNVFIKPVREEVAMYEDVTQHSKRMFHAYAWGEWGFGLTDTRRTLLVEI